MSEIPIALSSFGLSMRSRVGLISSMSSATTSGKKVCCYLSVPIYLQSISISRVARMLQERNMMTPNLKLGLAVSLSPDPGHKRNLKFDVNIFLSQSRWATLYFLPYSSSQRTQIQYCPPEKNPHSSRGALSSTRQHLSNAI